MALAGSLKFFFMGPESHFGIPATAQHWMGGTSLSHGLS